MNQSEEESLKRDYCAGVMTLREIGRKTTQQESSGTKSVRKAADAHTEKCIVTSERHNQGLWTSC
ncbi:hypothetical protein AH553_25590 [Salmonella enterica subsp. diarizonae]|nr:hypothetical protein [Salmonella enterica subsp. diarizonae]